MLQTYFSNLSQEAINQKGKGAKHVIEFVYPFSSGG